MKWPSLIANNNNNNNNNMRLKRVHLGKFWLGNNYKYCLIVYVFFKEPLKLTYALNVNEIWGQCYKENLLLA